MPQKKHKNILVCVSGLTPQIVSESLYCLSVQRKITIDEIYVLTTTRGKNVILGKDKGSSTSKIPLRNEIKKLCRHYSLKEPKFENNDKHIITAKEESAELNDIRDDSHNRLFPNKVSDFLRTISGMNNTIFCSISGGRKTMSVHLSLAMVLFGREQDKLLHVLTSEENEFKGFYPVNKSEDKALTIAEIPFIRLRSFLHNKVEQSLLDKQYVELVEATQQQLKQISSKKMIINIAKNELVLNNKRVKLEPLELALYYFFIESKKEGKEKHSIQVITSPETGQQIKSFIQEYYPYYYFDERRKNPWWAAGLADDNFRTKRSKINEKIKSLTDDANQQNLYCINSERKWGGTLYFIDAGLSQINISF